LWFLRFFSPFMEERVGGLIPPIKGEQSLDLKEEVSLEN
jgi:hypothetical protein